MPLSLAEVIDLRPPDARRQWLRVLARRPVSRQEPFLPIELVLSYGLFFVLDPHSYGGRNIDTLPDAAKKLGALFVRPPGSITNKMLNLDGSRKNGGRFEPLVAVALANTALLGHLYRLILEAARSLGIGPDRLPDFLDAELSPEPRLEGQEELGDDEFALALSEHRELVERLALHRIDEQDTVRLLEQNVRLGQHRFARRVLANYDYRCGFCGFSAQGVKGHRLLYASHVKPWRVATHSERLDPRNGIAACPVHDSAFDTGLLTVNGGLRIHLAAQLNAAVGRDFGAERFFGVEVLAERLIVDGSRGRGPHPKYLRYHQNNVFVG